MKKSELANLPNLGKTLSEKLNLVGIESAEDLIAAGSENAFIKLATVDQSACINMLYALEGAVQGIRWHDLDKLRKTELNEFFKIVKTKQSPAK
ncbi:MAG: competence protein TfoX [Bacteroidetes bacterium GWF2_38_335]|nr:MAG: competence protein TfoX [Bacteroidetes bacterium GWF2_38_335]OFY79792.1 MAG: competence protein TfoX [Bacteroidetes bacterium RIFOXYA12_FULL_38_20]HBS88180.1 competence protein TfoX [Bacteroidales bacterium]